MMEHTVVKIILIVAGCALIIFRKPFVEAIIGFQIRAFHMPFGKREVKQSSLLAIAIGLFAITAGILGLLGIVK